MVNFQLFWAYCKQYLKKILAYRTDFIAQYFADLMSQIVSLTFIIVIFGHTDNIVGWNRGEVLAIYGYFLLPYATFNAFFSNFFSVPEQYILKGEMDRVLTRPVNSLFQVIMEQIELDSLISGFTGLCVIMYAIWYEGLTFNPQTILVMPLLVLGSTLIYGGIYVSLASLAFWFEGNVALMPTVYNVSVYGRYPITVYKGAVRFILTFILPFAFVGFYPAATIFNWKNYSQIGYFTPVIGLIVFGVGAKIWSRGINHYTGAGN